MEIKSLCEICGKTFKGQNETNRHKRIHTGDSPHLYDFCGKLIVQKSNRTRHAKTHSKTLNTKYNKVQSVSEPQEPLAIYFPLFSFYY